MGCKDCVAYGDSLCSVVLGEGKIPWVDSACADCPGFCGFKCC